MGTGFPCTCFGSLVFVLCVCFICVSDITNIYPSHAKQNVPCKLFWERSMDALVIFSAFCISLSLLLSSCVGIQIQEQAIASRVGEVQLSLSAATLPRKLRVPILLDENTTPVKDHGVQGSTSRNNLEEGDISGKAYKKQENVMKGGRGRGTRQEWVEGIDTLQYFTMDYSHVRRRRPIHNKALPVGP